MLYSASFWSCFRLESFYFALILFTMNSKIKYFFTYVSKKSNLKVTHFLDFLTLNQPIFIYEDI